VASSVHCSGELKEFHGSRTTELICEDLFMAFWLSRSR